MTHQIDIESLRQRLEAHGQDHVLGFWDQLRPEQQRRLAGQLASVDLDQLSVLIEGQDATIDFAALAERAESPPAVRADGSGADWSLAEATDRGREALSAGQIGAVIVAGGQGTRLGFDPPKGMFPIGPVSQRTLFQVFADRLVAIDQRYGVRIPLYVMTSAATDAETQAYFQAHDFLGLPADDVMIFQQGTMPAVDSQTGRLLLAETDSLALSPDGHGGTVAALEKNGCFADMQQRGIKHLSYIQVDNPLAHLCEPGLIGHHLLSGSEMTTEVIRKRRPQEKVGNVVLVDGAVQIIEYSDLPESAAEARTPDGELKLWAGNIAVHMFDVDFLRRMQALADALPFHRALKKVSHVDAEGHRISPQQPNAVKFERFIFDLLPRAEQAIAVEVLPGEAFAPVKNAEGADADTPSLARHAMGALHASWLRQIGVSVPAEATVEINPRFALSAAELATKVPSELQIAGDRYFV